MRNTSLIKAMLVGFLAATPYVATDETLGKSVLTKIGAVKSADAAVTIREQTNKPLPVLDSPAEPNDYCDSWVSRTCTPPSPPSTRKQTPPGKSTIPIMWPTWS